MASYFRYGIDIKGLDKAKVLQALYNNANPLGLGFMHYDPVDITYDEAKMLVEKNYYFDSLKGRKLKISIRNDTFDCWFYDHFNGKGVARKAINSIRGQYGN